MVVPIDAFRSWLNNQYQTLGLDLLEARNGYDENNAVVIYFFVCLPIHKILLL